MSAAGTVKKFKDGEVIFREGEPSGSAYVIIRGSVELTKNSKHGAVLLAKLKSGELFGEMGVIDGSPRSATSRSIGATTVKEITPEALLNGIHNDPDLSSKVMSKLVERLRTADEMLARAGVSPADGSGARALSVPGQTPNTPKKPGFFSRLFGTQPKGRTKTFEILVANLFDDEAGNGTNVVFNALAQNAESLGGNLVNIRRTEAPFAINDFTESPMTWGQVKTNAQRWLQEQEADLLVWGQVRAKGEVIHLRMCQLKSLRNERAGYFQPCDAIDLPIETDEAINNYLYGVTVGAMIAANKEQNDAFDAILHTALESARPALKRKMRELDNDEKVRFELGFANLLATCGVVRKNGANLQEAESLYMKCARGLKRSKQPLLGGIIKRHLGYAQSAWFDMGGDKNLLEASVETLREACEYFTKDAYPTEWADLQAMIGQLLYKKDLQDENDLALKESIAAYQSALQVFSASASPRRWGDAKHHLARALQLLGSQTGDLDMIARSAEACREALAVRSKNQTPMLWAATQNNLGSALFMLCQKTRKPETAEAAVKAFQAALEVYEIRKSQKLAKVTQKNLARAQEVAIDLGPVMHPEMLTDQSGGEPAEQLESPPTEETGMIEGER